MKKSHIIIYLAALILVGVSYIYYTQVYASWQITTYLHSIHWAAFGYMLIPVLFELITKKELPLTIIIGYIVFIFASQIGGTAYDGYGRFAMLDLIVHGFSACLIVLFFAWLSGKQIKDLHIVHKIIYLLGAGMLVGVLWEVIEFCGDTWFGMNNQVYRYGTELYVGQEALKDTMLDFIWDLIGASVGTAIVCLQSVYSHKKQKKVQE